MTDIFKLARDAVVQEKFWSFVDQRASSSACWLWSGRLSNGYGILSCRGGQVRAHRLSLAMHTDAFDPKLFACHHCDNPRCVNPQHLYAGTAKQNARDMIERGRNNPLFGSKAVGAKLTEFKVFSIISRLFQGEASASLAAEFQIAVATVCEIRRREAWPHVWQQFPADKRMPSHPSRQGKSGFRGVTKNRKGWCARITTASGRITLGTFPTKEASARAYDQAALVHYSSNAELNFPLSEFAP